MASKTVRTPNSRLFATESGFGGDVDAEQKPRKVKNYMKSNIFDQPDGTNGVAHHQAACESDSGSETASNDGDRLQTRPVVVVPPPSTPTHDAAPVAAPKSRVPPGGYSSKLW